MNHKGTWWRDVFACSLLLVALTTSPTLSFRVFLLTVNTKLPLLTNSIPALSVVRSFNIAAKGCLATVAKRCQTLEVLHIEGSPTLDVLADVGWGLGQPTPLRFTALKV